MYDKSSTHYLTRNDHMINGPVNIIRLEGAVGSVKKVIYLFLDFHLETREQTQCSNIYSTDIQKYFVDTFVNSTSDKTYDFFVEVQPSEIFGEIESHAATSKMISNLKVSHTKSNRSTKSESKSSLYHEHKERYIDEVSKVFHKLFDYDRNKNQVIKTMSNIRLHYLDVRDYFQHNVFDELYETVMIANNSMKDDHLESADLDTIIQILETTQEYLQLVVDILKQTTVDKIKDVRILKAQSGVFDMQSIKYLASKMKHSYDKPEIKRKMESLMQISIRNFDNTIDYIAHMITKYNNYMKILDQDSNRLIRDPNTTYVYIYGPSSRTIRGMIFDVVNETETLFNEMFVEYFARLTDVYFLRRFLDKDYITNTVVYCGALHSNTYVHFLVKEMKFKITHISDPEHEPLEKINQLIPTLSLMEVQKLILPKTLSQCSTMKNFPNDFL